MEMISPENRVRLLFLRGLWVVTFALTVTLILASVQPRFAVLNTVSPEQKSGIGDLLPEDAQALEALGLSVRSYALFFTMLETLVAGAYLLVGVLIFWRRSGDWFALVSAIGLMSLGTIGTPLIDSLLVEHSAWQAAVFALRAIGFVFLVLFLFLFPDGRFVPRWTAGVFLLWLGYNLVWLFAPDLQPVVRIVNLSARDLAVFAWLLAWLCLGATIQVYRFFKVSNRVERQQTRWVVLGFAVSFIGTFFAFLFLTFIPVLRQPGPLRVLAELATFCFVLLSSIGIAVTMAVAILRYRLWDIDIVIRRTVAYSILSLILVGTYVSSVLMIQSIVAAVGGQQTALVTVLSTLAIAALFNPLRRWIQNFIDRRFYREKYDAERLLAAFAALARDEVDGDRLCAALAGVVQDTLQPSGISLWVN